MGISIQLKMTLFDILGNIYNKKNKTVPEIDTGYFIIINKWLSYDKDNIQSLNRIVKYLFFIEPEHYYYLLFFNIPKKFRMPFLKVKKDEEKEQTELVNKIKSYFNWSQNELNANIDILCRTVLKNEKYWKEQFGL